MPLSFVSAGVSRRQSKLKKKTLASDEERLALGTGWLPLMLRAVQPETQEDVAPVDD